MCSFDYKIKEIDACFGIGKAGIFLIYEPLQENTMMKMIYRYSVNAVFPGEFQTETNYCFLCRE
jgi:hypothetical protein